MAIPKTNKHTIPYGTLLLNPTGKHSWQSLLAILAVGDMATMDALEGMLRHD